MHSKMQITKNKFQKTNKEQITNNKKQNGVYEMEDRTMRFAKNIIGLCKIFPKDLISTEIIRQLIKASCSVGANYREANESLSKKDFIFRMKIARKECKEATYWLDLLTELNSTFYGNIRVLIIETRELRNIFSSIINKFTI